MKTILFCLTLATCRLYAQTQDTLILRHLPPDGSETTKNFYKTVQNKLNRIVSMYLDYAENQAKRHIAMTMKEWTQRLDGFLQLKEYAILKDAGRSAPISPKPSPKPNSNSTASFRTRSMNQISTKK